MSDLSQVSIARTLEAVAEAANAPADLGPPHAGESLSDLHERLLTTRAAMTRVSELTGDLALLSGKIKRLLIDRRGELEDEEAKTVTTRRPLTEDFSSARERNARLSASTLETRRKIRQAEKIQSDVEAALSYARDRHRELDRAVRDIDTRLRIVSIESHLS